MAFTPYDWNQSIQHRDDYVADRLREGSPIVGLRYDGGVALITARRSQQKVFEIYDRLMFAGLGSQSDVEAVRIAAIDFAHQEGFRRSPDDVTIQRAVGFYLSPILKRQFADPFRTPAIVRGVFAEVGATEGEDRFYFLDHDGEFEALPDFACASGPLESQQQMLRYIEARGARGPLPLQDAVRLGLRAWAIGCLDAPEGEEDPAAGGEREPALPSDEELDGALRDRLRELTPEVGVLDRHTPRESKFRQLSAEELGGMVP